MSALKILVADDEFWVRENLKSLLSDPEQTYAVLDPAVDGEDALQRVEIDRPDILITDIDMPFLNGNDLIRAVRRRHPHLPVIVLSGYADFSYVRQALLDGALDYLLKPVTRESLWEVVDRAVQCLQGQRTREQELAEQTEVLQRATALVKDGVLSDLLQGNASDRSGALTGWDLRYSVFTLFLIKVTEGTKDPARVKALIARESSGTGQSLVFHNLHAPHEFVALTDRNAPGVALLATRLSENLERLTGCPHTVAVSAPFYALGQLGRAYQEAKSALGARAVEEADRPVFFEQVKGRPIQSRITAEAEKLFSLALSTGNKALVREVAFDRIGLQNPKGWLLVEVRQTVESLATRMVEGTPRPAARTSLTLEAFGIRLARALDPPVLAEVTSLLDQWIDEVFPETGTGTSVSIRRTVLQVQEHIAERFGDNLSLASLADLFRVDGSYLSKAFKKVTGTTMMSAIARLRIEKAQEYIRDRDLSLTEVAALVGYEEYAYFNRVFHKVAGVSPSVFKAQSRRSPHERL